MQFGNITQDEIKFNCALTFGMYSLLQTIHTSSANDSNLTIAVVRKSSYYK